ncbi:AaceriAER440Cp [[Ashbya] aceris (nom. inval.)]|nr:AaceriAER440Cp [[Ashbya] aceris (nom. inval.)]
MASYMYYPNYARAGNGAPCPSMTQGATSGPASELSGALQTQAPVMHRVLPPMVPYSGYFQRPPSDLASNFDTHLQPSANYGMPNSYLYPVSGKPYMAPPPGLAPPMGIPMLTPSIQTSLPSQLQQRQQPQARSSQQVNGGVSEVLDYDLDIMTLFIIQNAYLIFGNEEQKADILEVFHKGVSSVLNATRLPSSTIYYALDYLAKYLGKLPHGIDSIGGDSVNVIYQNLMVAFVLANKFNDDKTFTNRSWSQATGMKVDVINTYEREWLYVFDWRLFEEGFGNYEAYRDAYQMYQLEKKRQRQQQMQPPAALNSYLSLPSGNSVLPPPACQSENYYPPSSPFSQQGYHTPSHSKAMVYSSPSHSDVRSDSYSSYYQPSFTSPMSNASPLPKSYNNYGPYYSQKRPQAGVGSVNSMSTNSFWNIPFDRADHYQHAGPSAQGYYCYSTAY